MLTVTQFARVLSQLKYVGQQRSIFWDYTNSYNISIGLRKSSCVSKPSCRFNYSKLFIECIKVISFVFLLFLLR